MYLRVAGLYRIVHCIFDLGLGAVDSDAKEDGGKAQGIFAVSGVVVIGRDGGVENDAIQGGGTYCCA